MSSLLLAALLLSSQGFASPTHQLPHSGSMITVAKRQYGYYYGDRGDRFNYGYLGLAIAIVIVFLAFVAWATVFRLKYGYWGCGCCCVSKQQRLERRRIRCPRCGALTNGPCQCTPMWVPVTVAPGGTAYAMTPPEYASHLHSMANAQPGANVMKQHPRANETGVTEYFQSAEHTPAAAPVGGYYNAENKHQQWASGPGQAPGFWRPAPPPPSGQPAPPAQQPSAGVDAPNTDSTQLATAPGAAQDAAAPKKGFKRFFK